VVQSPGYQSLSEVAISIGCDVVRWMPDPETLNFDVSGDGGLRRLVTPNTKLIIINFPHNPTGGLPSVGELEVMVGIAKKAGAYLFSDEMYRGLEEDEAAVLPCISDVYEKGVTLCGLSKSYALPGLRIGWIYTRDVPLCTRILELKDYTTICSSAPSELLALMALKSGPKILLRNRAIISQNKALLREFFSRHEDCFRWYEPAAGSMAMVRVKDEFLGNRTSLEYCEGLVKSHGILLLPSCQFDYGTKHIRVGLGREDCKMILPKWEESLWEDSLHPSKSSDGC